MIISDIVRLWSNVNTDAWFGIYITTITLKMIWQYLVKLKIRPKTQQFHAYRKRHLAQVYQKM